MKEIIVKINKTKSWFFEKIKLTHLQPDSSRKKEESNQKKLKENLKKIRSEKGEVTTDNAEIQKIMRLL